jgi:hypothetical protein
VTTFDLEHQRGHGMDHNDGLVTNIFASPARGATTWTNQGTTYDARTNPLRDATFRLRNGGLWGEQADVYDWWNPPNNVRTQFYLSSAYEHDGTTLEVSDMRCYDSTILQMHGSRFVESADAELPTGEREFLSTLHMYNSAWFGFSGTALEINGVPSVGPIFFADSFLPDQQENILSYLPKSAGTSGRNTFKVIIHEGFGGLLVFWDDPSFPP